MRAVNESADEVTNAGRHLREAAEAATDRNSYTPWQGLNESEVEEVHDLLARLKAALTHNAEAMPA